MIASTYPEMYENELSYFWFTGKQAYITRAMETLRHKGKLRILDVGCGTGGTTQILKQWGPVTGLEKNPIAAAFARTRGIRVVSSSSNSMPFKTRSFDVVTMLDVLYHKGVDERHTLSEIRRVLKPTGTLILTDCMFPFLTNRHDTIMDAKYRFTRTKLQTLLIQNGFTIDHMQYMFMSVFPVFAVSRLIGKIIPPSEKLPDIPAPVNTLLSNILRWEASGYPHSVPLPGSSMIITAHPA